MLNTIRMIRQNSYDMTQRNSAFPRSYTKKPRFFRQELPMVSQMSSMIFFKNSYIIRCVFSIVKIQNTSLNGRASQHAQLHSDYAALPRSGQGRLDSAVCYFSTRYFPSSQTSGISPSTQALSNALNISLILTGPALLMISSWKSSSTLTPIVIVFLGFLFFPIPAFYIKASTIANRFDTSNSIWYTVVTTETLNAFCVSLGSAFVLTIRLSYNTFWPRLNGQGALCFCGSYANKF